jgi:peroxiredoxin
MRKRFSFVLPSVLFILLVLPEQAEANPPDRSLPDTVAAAFSRAGIPVLRKRVAAFDFSLPLLTGKTQSLNDLKGRVVLLNFWATWCPPCREEMFSMEALYQRLSRAGFELLAVDIQEPRDRVSSFAENNRLSFPVALDTAGRISGTYGVRGLPTTYIIDRDGMIVAASVGGRDWSAPGVIAALEALLNYDR